MPGNSQRRNRRTTTKKGPSGGTGGKGRQSLEGRGKTLPASDRPWHKAYEGEDLPKKTAWKQDKERRAAAAEGRAPKAGGYVPGKTSDGKPFKKSAAVAKNAGGKARAGANRAVGRGGPARPRGGPRVAPGRRSTPPKDSPELLVGRNPVVEALRAHVPATALYVAAGIEADERVTEAIRTAGDRGIAILEISRGELDRLTGGVLHQGIGVQVPPFAYDAFEDLMAASLETQFPLLVALDGVTDPRNLGAVLRSAAAFGAQGIFVPERRAATVTASAWRTSAGAAARIPVAQVVNLTRAIRQAQQEGFVVVGLDADAPVSIYDLEVADGPLIVVVGSEGRGLSRLVGEACDLKVGIPMVSDIESLNAAVAAAVTLSEVARKRSA
jgi:23S rRNA (guanosine2251-2'-O)-methyltransferase